MDVAIRNSGFVLDTYASRTSTSAESSSIRLGLMALVAGLPGVENGWLSRLDGRLLGALLPKLRMSWVQQPLGVR